MRMFIAGLIIGATWKQIKWLTWDLIKAVVRGVYSAFSLACCGPLNEGYTRWDALKWLPKYGRREVAIFVKWEWWHGCHIE